MEEWITAKVLLAVGVQGELVRKVQKGLQDEGFDPRGVDGFFGLDTAQAVERLQRAHGLLPTGVVDATAWRLLLGTRPPGVRDFALQLTAAFEGHGFGRARGNWDGAGVTWGIIGFTLKHGELARIVRRVNEASPGWFVRRSG